jgi:hypothetical protein
MNTDRREFVTAAGIRFDLPVFVGSGLAGHARAPE